MFVKKPGIRKGKLDTSLITKGIFLGFTPTKRNAIYYDSSTRETKTARHFVIDEAHYSNDANRPTYARDILDNKKLTSLRQPNVSFVPRTNDKNSPITVLPSDLYLTKPHTPRSSPYKLSLKGDHHNLGFIFSTSDTNRIIINDIKVNTSAYRIPYWRATLRGCHIVSINDIQIQDTSYFASVVSSLHKNKNKHNLFLFVLTKRLTNTWILQSPKLHSIK